MGTLKSAGTSIFWILATISLSWTCISMAIKRAEIDANFVRSFAALLCSPGSSSGLLTNGPQFANDIITSFWTVGGEASGTGNSVYPGTIINLGMQVFQNTMQHINFLTAWNISRTVNHCAHYFDCLRTNRSKHDPAAVRGLGGALCGYYLLGLWWLSMDIRHGD